MYKFLIADDHPLFRDAIKQVITEHWNNAEIIEVSNLDDTKDMAKLHDDLDLVLLDLYMPGAEGFSGLLSLRKYAPMLPIVIISAEDDPDVISRALTYGAIGFIPKSSTRERIHKAIEAILSGQSYTPPELAQAIEEKRTTEHEIQNKFSLLTPAELGILELLTMGKANKIIAYELDIKESTVKAHISSILRKLNVHSRTQAVLAAKSLVF